LLARDFNLNARLLAFADKGIPANSVVPEHF